MFEKLKNLIKNNKGFLIKTTILLGMYFFLSDFSFAENTGIPGNGTEEEIKNKVIAVMVTLSTTLSVFLGLLTYLVTMFLSPEWITGNIFSIGDKLKAIWILISNVVYFAFAFILIYIAFMNIVGAGGNDYEFKSALPKFIVGILIVPFSWFLVNFLVTLSSILTIAALNLPIDTFKNYETGMKKVEIPAKCIINLNALSSEGKTEQGKTATNEIFHCPKEGRVSLSEVFKTDNSAESIFGITSLYTFGLTQIEDLTKINVKNLEQTIYTLGDTVVKVIFDLIFVIAYSLIMIALGLALMIRGIWLWIYMMLSPLFGLMYFFGKGKDGFFKNFNFIEFLHLCFVPVYTMLALSFGMLFIFTVGGGIKGGAVEALKSDSLKLEGDNLVINKKFTLQIIGPAASKETENVKDIFQAIGDGALGIIGALILKLFGIVVLWGTVMMALSKSEITKSIVEPIASFGENVGKAVTSIPQYTPILPGGQSLQSLKTAGASLDGAIREKYGVSERSNKFLEMAGLQKGIIDKKFDEFKTMGAINTNADIRKLMNMLQEIYKEKGDVMFNDSKVQEIMKKMSFTDDQISKTKNLNTFSTEWASIDKKGDIYQLGLTKDTTEQFMKGEISLPGTAEIKTPISLNNGKFTQEFKIDLGNGEQTISKGNNIGNIVNIIPDSIQDSDLRSKLRNANLDDATIEEIIKQAGDKVKTSQNLPNP